MARQLTVGSRSARMCLRAVTDTQAQQEGLGCGAHGGGWALCRKGRAVGGGPAARERGARVFAGLGPGTAGAPGGVAGARPVQDQPGGLLPTSPGLAPSSSPQSTAGAKASG